MAYLHNFIGFLVLNEEMELSIVYFGCEMNSSGVI